MERCIRVGDIGYYKEAILELSNNELKMLISQIEKESDLRTLQSWVKDNEYIRIHIDNIFFKL